MNCTVAIGLTVAITMTLPVSIVNPERASTLYQTWLWIAFALNSSMSLGVLTRIRYDILSLIPLDSNAHDNDIILHRMVISVSQQKGARYGTILKALIESAMLSWIATLGCAVAWTRATGCEYENEQFRFGRQDCFQVGELSVALSFGRSLNAFRQTSVGGSIDTDTEIYSTIMMLALPTLLVSIIYVY
jgi:hypothetical protein